MDDRLIQSSSPLQYCTVQLYSMWGDGGDKRERSLLTERVQDGATSARPKLTGKHIKNIKSSPRALTLSTKARGVMATLRAAAGLASRAPAAGTAATTLVDDATALISRSGWFCFVSFVGRTKGRNAWRVALRASRARGGNQNDASSANAITTVANSTWS